MAQSKKGIVVSQQKYTLDLLAETSLIAYKPADTLIDLNHYFIADVGDKLINVGRYQRLVGRLIYFTITRPNITYAVSVVSQFMYALTIVHLDAVNRILRYLKNSPSVGLLYSPQFDLCIKGYTDAYWIGSVTDRCSTSCYCTFIGGNLVTWRSKK